MNINLQPSLENEHIMLRPLLEHDFDALYEVASDPEIWVQHPNKDRWKKGVFKTFFEGAIQSRGAFIIVDKVAITRLGAKKVAEQEVTYFGETPKLNYVYEILKDNWLLS